jgi:hypothetical protein
MKKKRSAFLTVGSDGKLGADKVYATVRSTMWLVESPCTFPGNARLYTVLTAMNRVRVVRSVRAFKRAADLPSYQIVCVIETPNGVAAYGATAQIRGCHFFYP